MEQFRQRPAGVPPIAKRVKPELEKDAEDKLVKDVAKLGGKAIKYTSRTMRGVTDRIVMYNGWSIYVEMKRKGKTKLDPKQVIFKNICLQYCQLHTVVSGKSGVDSFMEWLRTIPPRPEMGLKEIYT